MKMIVWKLLLFSIFQVIAADIRRPLRSIPPLSFKQLTGNGAQQFPNVLYGITGGESLQPIFGAPEMQSIFPRHVQKVPNPKEKIQYTPKPNNMQFDQPDKPKVLTEQAKDQALDILIKDRIGALQNLQDNLNKLLENVANIASSFVSKHSFFGGVTRRSLFDPSTLDDIKVVSANMVDIGNDLNRISRNTLDDLDTFVHYMSDHRNFNFRNLFTNAFSAYDKIYDVTAFTKQ